MMEVENLKRNIYSRSQDLEESIAFTKKAICRCLKSAKKSLHQGDVNTGCCEMAAAKENGIYAEVFTDAKEYGYTLKQSNFNTGNFDVYVLDQNGKAIKSGLSVKIDDFNPKMWTKPKPAKVNPRKTGWRKKHEQ